MIDLKFKIEFLDYWHLSSGESGVAVMDSLVIRDNDGFPFVSGKTLKGLFRDSAEELRYIELVKECFGVLVTTLSDNHTFSYCFFVILVLIVRH